MSTALRNALLGSSPQRTERAPQPIRAWTLGISSAAIVSMSGVVMLLIGCITAFRARPLYRGMARVTARTVLWLYGIRLRTHHATPLPTGQIVFVSNHTSTLDLFVLIALGLPRCRFFLSGFLRQLLPLGAIAWLLGTFFTVPQDQPQERTRIFQRAERVLRETGESVYLSPEGARVVSGGPGHFNKGAFHLALNLGVPVVPFYIHIPASVDPGLGFDARPGIVDVSFLAAIDTRIWTTQNLAEHAAMVRAVIVRAREEWSCRS